MYDLLNHITKFHEEHVRLTNVQRADMRKRRETNLKRIKRGLAELNKPSFVDTINQGGYAQKTMTQPPEADQESRYDIDLGIVFEEEEAKGPRTTRNWVRDAISCNAFNIKNCPETKKKCVRVVYADGYQCDFPVFRRSWNGVGWNYELSTGDVWEASDPQSMNNWIESQISTKSGQLSGSYQLRRILRMGKFYSKTHANRHSRKFPSGLIATALFIEAYRSLYSRDDEAFRETLRVISYRSKYDSVYANGVKVSDVKDTDRIGRLIEEAKTSVTKLHKLDTDTAGEADACKVWEKIFRHSYFDRPKPIGLGAAGGLGLTVGTSSNSTELSETERMARMESAVNERKNSGGQRPWSG